MLKKIKISAPKHVSIKVFLLTIIIFLGVIAILIYILNNSANKSKVKTINSSQPKINVITEKNKQRIFDNTLKCKDQANKFYQQEKNTYPQAQLFYLSDYAYSDNLNACVVAYTVSEHQQDTERTDKTIWNLNTDEEVYYWAHTRYTGRNNSLSDITNNSVDIVGNKKEYDEIYSSLFNKER